MQHQMRLQRNIAITGFLLMLLVNSILAITVYREEKMIVLVPSIEGRLEVSSGSVSRDYLRLRAIEVHNLLFGMNKENCEKVKELLLQNIDQSGRAEVRKQLEVLSSDMVEREYYYNFTDITEYQINTLEYKVIISGYLETFIGDKRIGRELKRYLYEFVNRNGVVLLSRFNEVKEDERN